jgi:ABC-type glycerol-3-phosphate transport system substrate-binding protein
VRRLALLLIALALAGCGGSSKSTMTTNEAAPPGPGTTLYAGGDWAVVVDGEYATAFNRVAGSWKADKSNAVKINILGPEGDVSAMPQVAVELSAKKPLIESGMWVDGKELVVKGGGLTATKGTIYGAPGAPLTKGTHVAVAYGRTAEHAHAVLWMFGVA